MSSGQRKTIVTPCSPNRPRYSHQSVSEAFSTCGSVPLASATATNLRSSMSKGLSLGSAGNSWNSRSGCRFTATVRQYSGFDWLSWINLKNASPGPGCPEGLRFFRYSARIDCVSSSRTRQSLRTWRSLSTLLRTQRGPAGPCAPLATTATLVSTTTSVLPVVTREPPVLLAPPRSWPQSPRTGRRRSPPANWRCSRTGPPRGV